MKKAIVVGATSGIGKSLSMILADSGYKVGIIGRRENLLLEMEKQRPDSFVPQAFDISQINNVTDCLNDLTNRLGGLDLLVISAGVVNFNLDLERKIERETIEINVAGFSEIVIWAFSFFKIQRYGHLVAITSIGGLRGGRYTPAYNASKAFQINYLEGIRHKCASLKLPITITDIRPGFVDTYMAKGEGKFWVSPLDKACAQIFKAIVKKKSVAYITRRWAIIGFLFKIIPRGLYQQLVLRISR
jgi:short-subunit dehydrogenase